MKEIFATGEISSILEEGSQCPAPCTGPMFAASHGVVLAWGFSPKVGNHRVMFPASSGRGWCLKFAWDKQLSMLWDIPRQFLWVFQAFQVKRASRKSSGTCSFLFTYLLKLYKVYLNLQLVWFCLTWTPNDHILINVGFLPDWGGWRGGLWAPYSRYQGGSNFDSASQHLLMTSCSGGWAKLKDGQVAPCAAGSQSRLGLYL